MAYPDPPRRRPARVRLLTWTAVLVTGPLLAGCTGTPPVSKPDPRPPTRSAVASPSPTKPRPFTVISTDPVHVVDPVAVTDSDSSMVVTNAFQQLMTAEPGQSVLKPDAARDCLFTAAKVYTCTLNEELVFHNGHQLTSSDVKFSIQRATRLGVPGSSAPLLGSLRRIETPDPLTVRFVLSEPDTQFGWALAAPAASIVDEEIYDADQIRGAEQVIVGSGPFRVTTFDPATLDRILVRHTNYVGRHAARLDTVQYRVAPDSAAIEDAMKAGEVDVVWRGLGDAAVTRISNQISESDDGLSQNGFGVTVLPGARVHQIMWSPDSPRRGNAAIRTAITQALQEDRTSNSIVPTGVAGYVPSFPAGGSADSEVTWKNRIRLTLAYDPTSPDAADRVRRIRDRLESNGGLSVQLPPDGTDADLRLLDRKAWTATPLAWLQPYVENPLPTSESTIESIEGAYRTTTEDQRALRLLAALQKQSALDQTVLPFSQSDEMVFVRSGVEIGDKSYGPNWQLGLFGMGYV